MKAFRSFFLALAPWAAWVHAVYPQGYAPDVAVSKMQIADGLVVKLFASEPDVRQTILVKCDDRGRLWTIQYLQYPNPAGLKRVKVDRWSRTVYDRIPEPPPHGPRGSDRITILEDVDGDGRADRFKDFASGLNLATGLAFGHGGVFVLNVPYLLFYPDQDRDDVPDREPQVLLQGFGMEDAQSLANHLTWGPDGWLYGVNGSTTTCRIRGIEFQQGVWRYHPVSREFELFCEGGGNTFGLTFDENGELYYSTNDGPFVHAVQGGYFYKSFGKHGPLHNPYAYHYFSPLQRDQVPGGPPTGGTIYLGDAFPQELHGAFIAGNFLGHTVSWWAVEPLGATVRARFGGVLLDARDSWFGPTDMCLGPGGEMYVCDFHDQRTAHPDPDAHWDRSNGRIYKIEAAGASPVGRFDLGKLTTQELVALLSHRNRWYAGWNEETACALLEHPYAYLRAWTVRLMADGRAVSPRLAARLISLASRETNEIVCCQLAASAKRLPGEDGLRIVEELLKRDLDESESRMDWLVWWAIEDKAVSDTKQLLEIFARPEAWQSRSFRPQTQRLLRRLAAEGTVTSYDACLRLITSAPTTAELRSAHQQLSLGLDERALGLPEVGAGTLFQEQAQIATNTGSNSGRRFEPLTGALKMHILKTWQQHPTDPLYLRLALRAGQRAAYQTVLAALADAAEDVNAKASMLELVRDFGQQDCVPHVVTLVSDDQPEPIQRAALAVLARFADPAASARIISEYPRMSPELRSQPRGAAEPSPVGTVTSRNGRSGRHTRRRNPRGRIAARGAARRRDARRPGAQTLGKHRTWHQ
jgi:putative membrane-bound dehydrogenase-like protein